MTDDALKFALDALLSSTNSKRDEVLIEAEECRRSLLHFTKRAWKVIEPAKDFHVNWHHEAICDHLEAVARGEIKRLVINIPFRSAKSTLVGVMFPTWRWIDSPSEQFISISYAEHLAIRDNLKHRRVGESPWYRERWGHVWKFAGDQNQKGRFENDKAGYRIAFGVTGSVMGEGGSCIIIDDPMDRNAANSEAERDKINTIYDEAIVTRLNDPAKSSIILIMQRLAENDLTGHVLGGADDWTHLMIPMRYEYDRHCVTYFSDYVWEDPRRYDEGGEELPPDECNGVLMDPERFPLETVQKLEEILGPYGTSGQFQQNPTPAGGGIIKEDEWKWWPPPEWGEPEPGKQHKLPACDFVVASLDTALTEKEENDYSALTVWGIWRDTGFSSITPRTSLNIGPTPQDSIRVMMPESEKPHIILMYAWAKRLNLHGPPEVVPEGMSIDEWRSPHMKKFRMAKWGLVEWVIQTCRDFGVHKLLIENSARGHDVVNEMIRLYAGEPWTMDLIPPIKSKLARVHSVAPLFSNGQVYAPSIYIPKDGEWRRPTWAEQVIRQFVVFPKGEHDDLVDSSTQALRYLRDIGLALRQNEAEIVYENDLVRSMRPQRPLYDV